MMFERVEGPIGAPRGDFNAATIASTIANVFRGKKSKAAKIKDFLPDWDKKPQTPQQQMNIFKRIRMAYEAAKGKIRT